MGALLPCSHLVLTEVDGVKAYLVGNIDEDWHEYVGGGRVRGELRDGGREEGDEEADCDPRPRREEV